MRCSGKAETIQGVGVQGRSDFWSSILRSDVQLAGSQPRDRRKIFTHTQAVKDVTLQDASVNATCVASVRRSWNREKTKLVFLYQAKSGTGFRVAASGNGVTKPHGKDCRERIRVAMMCDDAGQQRLRTAEERLAPAALATKAAQEGQALPGRVELAKESRDEKKNEARVTNNAENEKLRGDSTKAISRIEDGNKPVGGPLVSAEVSNRSEGVLPSRKRGSEEQEAFKDLMLECMQTRWKCASARWQ